MGRMQRAECSYEASTLASKSFSFFFVEQDFVKS